MKRGVKLQWMVPPVVALLIVAIANGVQRSSITEVKKQTTTLREALAQTGSRSGDVAFDAGGSGRPTNATTGKTDEPIDWKDIALKMAESQDGPGPGNMRTMIQLHKRMQGLSAVQISAALDEIAALEVPDQGRMMLEQMLMGLMVQKSPEEALRLFADKIGGDGGGMAWQLSSGLSTWAKTDPVAASIWLDEQVAAGKLDSKSLDGRSQSRMQFESALIGSLISGDSDAAKARVMAMPEDQRQQLLSQIPGGTVDPKKYAEVVRGTLTKPEEIHSAIASVASNLANQEGYEGVGKFMDEIGSSPAERAAVVEQTATSQIGQLGWQKKVKREDIDTMREWVAKEAPGSEDRLTGKALANVSQNSRATSFSEAAELVTDFHQSSGSDDVLVGFLSERHIPNEQRDLARQLAEKIADPKQREEILNRIQP